MNTTNERVNFFAIGKLIDLQKAIQFCRNYNILPDSEPKNCVNCNSKSKVVTKVISENVNIPYLLFCNSCKKENSITTNTWFEGSDSTMTILQNIGLIYCWLHGMTIQRACSELNLNSQTVVDYFGFCRDVCYVICTNSSEPIGGPSKIVELDESYITTTRFNNERVLRDEKKKVWVFGGIEKQSKKYFILRVYRRDKDTLVNLIKHFILPGTRVSIDGWKSHSILVKEGYIHDLRNHSIEFLTNEDNTSERVWETLKGTIKRQGRPDVCEDTYIFQYLYLNQLKLRNYRYPSEQLPVFLRDISKVYAGYGGTNLLPKSYTGGDIEDNEDE